MDDVKVYKDKAKVDMLYQQLKRADNWDTDKRWKSFLTFPLSKGVEYGTKG